MPQYKLKQAQTSGTSNKSNPNIIKNTEVPSLLAYPKILSLDDVKDELEGKAVYVVKEYPEEGIGVLIYNESRNNEIFTATKFGDWDGNLLDPNDRNSKYYTHIQNFINSHMIRMINIFKMIGLEQGMLYISCNENSDELLLVDLRLSFNKFAGPGMVNELFSKSISTQELVMKPLIINDTTRSSITKNNGAIIKTSTFKTTVRDKEVHPLYGRIS